MKKILLSTAVLVMISITTSCTKDYTCTCTADDTQYNETYTASDMSSSDASTWCDSWDQTGGTISGWNCTLN